MKPPSLTIPDETKAPALLPEAELRALGVGERYDETAAAETEAALLARAEALRAKAQLR